MIKKIYNSKIKNKQIKIEIKKDYLIKFDKK